jgi:hypothetical protein
MLLLLLLLACQDVAFTVAGFVMMLLLLLLAYKMLLLLLLGISFVAGIPGFAGVPTVVVYLPCCCWNIRASIFKRLRSPGIDSARLGIDSWAP